MSDEKTIVVFRVWKDESNTVFALFPEDKASDYYCSSYEHIGQHGGADYTGCIQRSRPATPQEYAALKRELESSPYHYRLAVRRRYTRRRV